MIVHLWSIEFEEMRQAMKKLQQENHDLRVVIDKILANNGTSPTSGIVVHNNIETSVQSMTNSAPTVVSTCSAR
jgi:hypothetical protein